MQTDVNSLKFDKQVYMQLEYKLNLCRKFGCCVGYNGCNNLKK